MQQKAIRADPTAELRHSGAPLQYSSCGRIGHWLVVSGDIESCRADQDSWFTSARGEPATMVEKPQVGPARGTGVQRRPLVPQSLTINEGVMRTASTTSASLIDRHNPSCLPERGWKSIGSFRRFHIIGTLLVVLAVSVALNAID
jgi:hypothetical protein